MYQKFEPYPLDLSFRGWVQGLTLLSSNSTPKCHLFGGIPYAQPPIRFQKPKSLAPCYRYGTKNDPAKFTQGCGVCPQGNSGEQGDETSADSNWDEDCLQLNIWIPAEKVPKKRWPVLFYIHGGFLQWGSPNKIDMSAFMNESPTKCIVVAPAYRLNVFGFLASPELLEASPDVGLNLGFWDQRMALQWTYENINYFGGDPSNITVAGYSAGSYSVFQQLAYDLGLPDNKAVIKRAMMLSNGPGMQPKSLDEAHLQFEELLNILDIPLSLKPSEKLAKLRSLPAKSFIDATNKMHLHQIRAVTDNSFVRKDLLHELNTGLFAQRMKNRNLHLMIGECSDEHFSYGAWRTPQPGYENLFRRLEADYPREACKVIMAHYLPNRKLPAHYKNWKDAFGCIYADMQIHMLGRGMVNMLIKHGAGHLVHRYHIEWRAECVDDDMPRSWGASHASDQAIWFWGKSKKLSDEEKEIIRQSFHELLSRFVKGEDMDWGTRDAMQLRVLRKDGKVEFRDDERMEEGMRVWNALKKVGATGSQKDVANL